MDGKKNERRKLSTELRRHDGTGLIDGDGVGPRRPDVETEQQH